jgi:5-methylcytosine-specific restriction endonuclease McrA
MTGRFKAIDETGNRYERLFVLQRANESGAAKWICECDCGAIKTVTANALRKGHVRSCGCLQKELASARQRKGVGESLWNTTISTYKHGAKRRGHSWELLREQAITIMSENCHYCNSRPNNLKVSKWDELLYNGIDRVDNGKGYTPDNCVTCCRVCNYAKGSMSHAEFIEWVLRVAAFHSSP